MANSVPIFLNLLFFFSAAFICFTITKNSRSILSIFRDKLFITIFLSALIFKGFFLFFPFYGLEYEDSYVFTSCTRFLHFTSDWLHDPFQTKTCIAGSIESCNSFATFGGHFITLSYLGFLITKITGYNNLIICSINFASSLLSIPILFKLSENIFRKKSVSYFVIFCYTIAPAINCFHTSGLSETFSSFIILLSLLFYFKSSKNETVFFIGYIIFTCFAICIKRENVILLFFPILDFFICKCYKQKFRVSSLQILFGYVFFILLILFLHYQVNVFTLEGNESLDIGQSTFSIGNQINQFPTFIKCLLTFNYFTVLGYFLLIGLVLLLFLHKANHFVLYPFGLIVLYSILYTSHYRSYYAVKYNELVPFEYLRYITNIFPFIALFVGYWLDYLWKKCEPFFNPIFFLVPTIIIIAYLSVAVRLDFSKEEKYNRVDPVLNVINMIDERNDIVLSDIPMVFQIMGKQYLQIYDFTGMNADKVKNLAYRKTLNKKANIYLMIRINKEERDMDINRWPEAFSIIRNFKSEVIKEELGPYTLMKIEL